MRHHPRPRRRVRGGGQRGADDHLRTARQFFFEQTEKFERLEAKEFPSDPDPDHVEAGIESLTKFGPINILESLSNGDVTKWESIKGIDLGTIFTKLRLNRDKSEFQRKLAEILRNKNKAS